MHDFGLMVFKNIIQIFLTAQFWGENHRLKDSLPGSFKINACTLLFLPPI